MVLALYNILDDGAVELGQDGDHNGVEEHSEDDPPALLLDLVFFKLDDPDQFDACHSDNTCKRRKQNDNEAVGAACTALILVHHTLACLTP